MKNIDKMLIIERLKTLNNQHEEIINKSESIVEFWRIRVEEYGENSSTGVGSTYGSELKLSLKNSKETKEIYNNLIKENERLIKVVEEA